MNTCQTGKTYHLSHPLLDVPAIAVSRGKWLDKSTGRVIGAKLQFADGHTCHLTFDEIHSYGLMAAAQV